MRIRRVLWPALVSHATLTACLVLLLAPQGLTFWALFAGFLVVDPLKDIWRPDARLTPQGLQRSSDKDPAFVPWERVQTVALAGDTAGMCPTLWTDDGREIALGELGKELGVGGRQVQRNYERIRDYWEAHRGLAWQAEPWAAEGVTPAPITARLRPAWYTWAAYATLISLPVASAPLFRAIWGSWSTRTELLLALLAVVALWMIWAGTGARLSAYGLARGHGTQDRVAWPDVQGVTITQGRWFASPIVRAGNGREIKFGSLGVIFGVGRKRAARMEQLLEQAWLDHRGAGWRPFPAPAAAPQTFPPRTDVNYWAPPPA